MSAAAPGFVPDLYGLHGTVLLSYARRLCGDPWTAQDIVQEAMTRAWRAADRLDAAPEELRPWLLRVVHNLAVDRSRRLLARPVEVDAGSAPPPAHRDHADLVADAVTVRGALAELGPPHRAVLVHVYYGGSTAAEAARALDIPVGTAKSRLHHGLRHLRAILAGERATG